METELNEKQIRRFGNSILISDILEYIEKHRSEYEEFIKKEELEAKRRKTNGKK